MKDIKRNGRLGRRAWGNYEVCKKVSGKELDLRLSRNSSFEKG
jgi:hypothetical protein